MHLKLAVIFSSLAATTIAASASPSDDPENGVVTHERWGGGVRLTGLSGIGALPGVNYGGEVAVHVRRDEVYGELALGRWMPEENYTVMESPDNSVDLKLDLWTLRAGWASMSMPLRAWVLFEVGELAGPRGMPGVVSRMMMGDTPSQRQWRAGGGGVGVAWPISNQARLIGNLEMAIPVGREPLVLDRYGSYEADPIVARYSVGLEVGWR